LISRREFVGGSLALGALALLSGCDQPDHDARARRAPVPRKLTDRPNILFVVSDDQDYESLAKMRYLRSVPWYEFVNNVATTPLCSPARATLMTGLQSHHHGVVGNDSGTPFDPSSTVAVDLASVGYRNGLIGKHIGPAPQQPGWHTWARLDTIKSFYDFHLYEGNVPKRYHGQYMTDVLFEKARHFVTSTDGPWFLYLAPYAPHEPYEPAARHAGSFAHEPIDHSPNFNEADVSDKPQWIQHLPRLSSREIEVFDTDQRHRWEQLQALDEGMASLVPLLPDNTIVMFTSDNGLCNGAHRWRSKSVPYQESTRTPLLVRWPGIDQRTARREVVGSIDIAPTLWDLANAPGRASDGQSLVPLLDGSARSWRDGVMSLLQWAVREDPRAPELPTWWAWQDANWKYVELPTGEVELYDLRNDPYELQSLGTAAHHAAKRSELAARLATARSATPRMAPVSS
jgi:arylsulfatase A-like enzyme